jgi:hypothetical protein
MASQAMGRWYLSGSHGLAAMAFKSLVGAHGLAAMTFKSLVGAQGRGAMAAKSLVGAHRLAAMAAKSLFAAHGPAGHGPLVVAPHSPIAIWRSRAFLFCLVESPWTAKEASAV